MPATTWTYSLFNKKSLVDGMILRKFAVTLAGNEGTFSGVLTASDGISLMFEQCVTDKNQPIAGRVIVDRVNVAYLQQLEVGT